MAKRMTASALGLGVKKTTKVDKRKRKNSSKVGVLLRDVIDYLKYDSYMYAPLSSSPPKSLSSNRTEVSFLKEEDNKNLNLGAKVMEYLKSDDYMYAPLLLHQPWDQIQASPRPPHLEAEEVMEGPTTQASYKENKNMNIPEDSNVDRSRLVRSRMSYHNHGGAVKHIVHQQTVSVSPPLTPGLVRRTRGSRNVIVE